ncbi:MAG: N-acyl-D-aspartate/D-glutamate deacylase [Verrucomicrobiales bacterium]|nr:N-acyl-D-aspartate/D-glutamate deacylase [Verrucomicrobiales bacterium]
MHRPVASSFHSKDVSFTNIPVRKLLLTFALTLTFLARGENYDLILRNGQIIDGTGAPAYHGDVAIANGRVAALGKVDGTAKREIDVVGNVIAPGFIDVHTHAEDIETLPLAENFLRMGVTSLVLGNCGSSKLDLGKFYNDMERKTFSPNIASLVGHGTVRAKAMGGSFDRPPSAAELAKMKSYVAKAMDDGAVGMSTGLIYLPGTFAKTDELVEVAKVVGARGGIYTSHMRDEGTHIDDSLSEVFHIAREGHMRAEVSHIKLSGPTSWHRSEQVLKEIESARAEGLKITQDEYAYTASSTSLSQLIPEGAREGGKFKQRIADPKQKADIIKQMHGMLKRRGTPDYSYAVIASFRADKSLNGKNVPEAAKMKLGSDSLDNQIELILDVEKRGGASAVFHGMDEQDLQTFLRHTNTMIAADSGVRKFGESVPHPRGYGNNARVLGRYVRELKVLTLEDAVRKMTGLPAMSFQLKDRGVLKPGACADIAVFDPATVTDNGTYKDPHHYSTGFKLVLVNGAITVENDKHIGARNGEVLRLNGSRKSHAHLVSPRQS